MFVYVFPFLNSDSTLSLVQNFVSVCLSWHLDVRFSPCLLIISTEPKKSSVGHSQQIFDSRRRSIETIYFPENYFPRRRSLARVMKVKQNMCP
jgi:hypothetical protein